MFDPFLATFGMKVRQDYVNQQLLEEVVNLQNQQIQKLDLLQQSVESLQLGGFHSGVACLTAASKEHRTKEEQYDLVIQAKQYHFII